MSSYYQPNWNSFSLQSIPHSNYPSFGCPCPFPCPCFLAFVHLNNQHLQAQGVNAHLSNFFQPIFSCMPFQRGLETQLLNHQSCANPIEVPSANNESSFGGQIKNIIDFFICNYGLMRKKDILSIRKQYADQNTELADVFDALVKKYSSSRKPKEELVKWIIRKILMTGKQAIKQGRKMNQKNLSNILCQRYSLFTEKKEEYNDSQSDECEEKTQELLPYKKNSKCKTINSQFIQKLFESEEFQQDYETFMDQFDQIIQQSNTDKIDKFVVFVSECIQKKDVNSIHKYKRAPWLKVWADKVKSIALDLEEKYLKTKTIKLVKFEDSDC